MSSVIRLGEMHVRASCEARFPVVGEQQFDSQRRERRPQQVLDDGRVFDDEDLG